MKSSSRGLGICGCAASAGMVMLSAALSACGGNIEPQEAPGTIGAAPVARPAVSPIAQRGVDVLARPASPNAAPDPAATPRGVLLDGVPGTYACAALRGYVDDSTLGISAEAAVTERLRLHAVIAPTATVGQVNATLKALGARIVSMQPGNSEVTLHLVTPGGRPSKTDVARQLIATHAFESVDGLQPTARLMPTATTPPPFDPQAPAPVEDHQSPS